MASFDVGCRHIEITRRVALYPERILDCVEHHSAYLPNILNEFGYDMWKFSVSLKVQDQLVVYSTVKG